MALPAVLCVWMPCSQQVCEEPSPKALCCCAAGTQLLAFMDASRSGSLLDLPYSTQLGRDTEGQLLVEWREDQVARAAGKVGHTLILQGSVQSSNVCCTDYDMPSQHSTAQHSTAQHSTAQHSTAQHSTAQHSTAQHSTAQHRL